MQALAGSGPWPTLYLLDAPITFVIAAKIAPATDDLDELLAHRTSQVRTDVIPDENHATIWPREVIRGLVHLYQNSCDNSARVPTAAGDPHLPIAIYSRI